MNNSLLALEKARILVVGVIRDGEDKLSTEIYRLRDSFSDAKVVSFYVVESDSTDNTRDVLSNLKSSLPNFGFTTLGTLSISIPNRVKRIAHCRNIYLEYVKSHKHDFDFIVVADLDGVNSLLDASSIRSCWSRSDWDVCTANQLGPYYDIYALRSTGWSEGDCWDEVSELVNYGYHPLKAWKKAVRDKQIRIPKGSDWIEVDSSFGGLALYSTESFIHGCYSDLDDANKVCEHVVFNKAVKQNGNRIFINPNLINFSYNIHNDWHRLSRKIKYQIRYLLSWLMPNWYIRKFMPELGQR